MMTTEIVCGDELEAIDGKSSSYFDEETGAVAPASTHRKPPTVVAPGGRNNGAKRRQVKLTQTQRAVAKQLGLTDEQYARQLIKEM